MVPIYYFLRTYFSVYFLYYKRIFGGGWLKGSYEVGLWAPNKEVAGVLGLAENSSSQWLIMIFLNKLLVPKEQIIQECVWLYNNPHVVSLK